MKKIFAVLFFISLMCCFAFAQSALPEIDIVREIKLLKSTKSDVKAIMAEFELDEDDEEETDEEDEGYNQLFGSDNAKVTVYYSTGGCSEEAGFANRPDWNVPKMTATKVVIEFWKTVEFKNLKFNLSGFKKRLKYEDDQDDEEDEDARDYVYYDEKAGIIITTDGGDIDQIILHPPKRQIGYLCSNETNSEILSGETKFVDFIFKSRIPECLNSPSKVTNLDLKTNGVFGCKDEKCLDAKKEISVTTTAVDLDGDQLVYQYIVSGGKINGSGSNVVWDLMGVEPGTYTITAGSDDGCGICGETKTQEIIVRENSYEIVPQPSANTKEVILDKTELIAACPVGRLQRVRCESGTCGIAVTSTSADGKNLIYKYKTDGGEVIGSGNKVIWDLANLKPDEYRIEVSASKDGTVFGEPKTATVVIKENPSCTLPKK